MYRWLVTSPIPPIKLKASGVKWPLLNLTYILLTSPINFENSSYSYNVTSAEPEPADLQWSGQKFGLDYNFLMCYDIANILANSMEFGNSYIRSYNYNSYI